MDLFLFLFFLVNFQNKRNDLEVIKMQLIFQSYASRQKGRLSYEFLYCFYLVFKIRIFERFLNNLLLKASKTVGATMQNIFHHSLPIERS